MATESSIILENLLRSEQYFRKVVYHITPEYFKEASEKKIVEMISAYTAKYSSMPSIEALQIEAKKLKITEQVHNSIQDKLKGIDEAPSVRPDMEWLFDMSERYCKEQAVVNAIDEAIGIMDGSVKGKSRGDLVELFSKATALSFDSSIGHEYFRSADHQYEFYTKPEFRIPFDLEVLNRITKGGTTRKTLNVLMSTKTGGFKSGSLCHLSARWFLAGYNVLYVTLEMSEERIRERIDANLIGVKIDDFRSVTKGWYDDKIEAIKKKSPGRLLVKEFPTGSAHSGHLRFLLKEIEQKENFKPDIVVLDYLNLMGSQRLHGTDSDSYTRVKSVTEEFRGLAVERDFSAWSATQSGRQGVKAGDKIDVDDVSESYGLPQTVDLMLAIISSEELSKKGLLMFKQVKNRYEDADLLPIFTLGVDKAKMTLFEDPSVANTRAFIPPSAKKEENRSRSAFESWSIDPEALD